jgi:hypothetical protein
LGADVAQAAADNAAHQPRAEIRDQIPQALEQGEKALQALKTKVTAIREQIATENQAVPVAQVYSPQTASAPVASDAGQVAAATSPPSTAHSGAPVPTPALQVVTPQPAIAPDVSQGEAEAMLGGLSKTKLKQIAKQIGQDQDHLRVPGYSRESDKQVLLDALLTPQRRQLAVELAQALEPPIPSAAVDLHSSTRGIQL